MSTQITPSQFALGLGATVSGIALSTVNRTCFDNPQQCEESNYALHAGLSMVPLVTGIAYATFKRCYNKVLGTQDQPLLTIAKTIEDIANVSAPYLSVGAYLAAGCQFIKFIEMFPSSQQQPMHAVKIFVTGAPFTFPMTILSAIIAYGITNAILPNNITRISDLTARFADIGAFCIGAGSTVRALGRHINPSADQHDWSLWIDVVVSAGSTAAIANYHLVKNAFGYQSRWGALATGAAAAYSALQIFDSTVLGPNPSFFATCSVLALAPLVTSASYTAIRKCAEYFAQKTLTKQTEQPVETVSESWRVNSHEYQVSRLGEEILLRYKTPGAQFSDPVVLQEGETGYRSRFAGKHMVILPSGQPSFASPEKRYSHKGFDLYLVPVKLPENGRRLFWQLRNPSGEGFIQVPFSEATRGHYYYENWDEYVVGYEQKTPDCRRGVDEFAVTDIVMKNQSNRTEGYSFIVKLISTYNRKSRVDPNLRLGSMVWAVTILHRKGTGGQHAQLIAEGCEEGKYFAFSAEFNGENTIKQNYLVGGPESADRLEGNFRSMGRTSMFYRPRPLIERMINHIITEDELSQHGQLTIPYSSLGSRSSFGGGRDNCFSKARKWFTLADIYLPRHWADCIAELVSNHTCKPKGEVTGLKNEGELWEM